MRCSAGLLVKILLVLLALPLVAGGVGAVEPATNQNLEQVKRQFRQFYLQSIPADPKLALEYATSLQPDGSWRDIDYRAKERAEWPAMIHFTRVAAMTNVLVGDPSKGARFEEPVCRALAYWRQNDFQCPNWFQNRIGVPRRLLQVALMLGDRLPSADYEYITRIASERSTIGKSTGQNRVWLAGCTLMNGLLLGNEDQIKQAADTIFAECVVTTKDEGLQPDFSFRQHGPQQQFGNYGLSFANDQVEWLGILRGTKWAMPAAQLTALRRYLLEGENWVVWRGLMDIGSLGRGFSPGAADTRATRLSRTMSLMESLDPSHSAGYRSYVKRNAPGAKNDLVGCQYFWRSDYLISRHKDWCLALKMSSKRVAGTESLNGQNLSGYYLGDGVTYFHRTGEEYRDIYPLWNWRMLPGLTCAQNSGPMPYFVTHRLNSDLVGAVTDGANACAVLNYTRDGVSAKKAWFLHGEHIVCLGSGVSAGSEVAAPVVTTVNQCFLRGSVRARVGKSVATVSKGSHTYTDLQWLEHDGFRYTLPAGQKVTLSCGERSGNWDKVFQTVTTPKKDVTGQIFTLSIDHGASPTNGSYAYCVGPTAAGPAEFAVLSNSPELQAVRFGDGMVEAVFHAPGKLAYQKGRTVSVDSPCLVLLDGRTGRAMLADPTQKLTSLNLEIDGKTHTVSLPAGAEAGKSVAVR